ncbi:MAG: CBS domain-containing protein [Rhizobiales bacterium]|nr:CBS domain-containing protein [Hyphomicrobiales bacterium]
MNSSVQMNDADFDCWPTLSWIAEEPMAAIKEIVDRKVATLKSVSPVACVSDVLELLEFDDAGAMIVSRDGKTVVGIISERDIVRGLRYYGPEILNVEVACLMSIDIVSCNITDSVADALSIMKNYQVRHLPVLCSGELAGFVSISDLIDMPAGRA